MFKKILPLLAIATIFSSPVLAQHSVAREWNEVLLEAIRRDVSRPTVHARNLFHTSVAMYDAWATYDRTADTYFLGRTVGDYTCAFKGTVPPSDTTSAQKEALSYAAYRLLSHRFKISPNASTSLARFDSLMTALNYDPTITSTNYTTGSPAALGNYIAEQLIAFGLQDNANEQNRYANQYYTTTNPNLIPTLSGNPDIIDPNHWQPLTLETFIDQAGNVHEITTPVALSPEWGQVTAFALTEDDLTRYQRDNYDYWVYHDPGTPPNIDTTQVGGMSEQYKWTFSLVAVWSSHLDPTDGVMWDISPASLGNNPELPTQFEDYPNFYNLLEGGDSSRGHAVNPYTGLPYEPQIVPRGDYTRVLAEFWADGPDSETPPGHWFTILNYVSDHPLFEKKFRGDGETLDDLEWDVKAYFALGGTVHDAAVSAWGIKGWYDYIRPISAIRYMADRGQSTNPDLPRYHPAGIPLIDNFIELVASGDSLAGTNNENINKIKLRAWRGPDYIQNPDTDDAQVGWILAENWWPYQRPTFITPPFPGYISGHSTFSRAAAEMMTLLTGDAYFPGGLGEFPARKNEFLVFEEGPSVDITLQWATYRDASDQTSLSRIWGGIHPPADDIPGRIIGIEIGTDAFQKAERYFLGQLPDTQIAGDFNQSNTVDFSDFLIFAQNFGKQQGDEDFNDICDLSGNGTVGFEDFLTFVSLYQNAS